MSSLWNLLDRPFQRNANAAEPKIEVLPGSIPVLLTAPHAVNHRRMDGTPKQADLFTGGLVRLMAWKTGCHAIITRNLGASDNLCYQKTLTLCHKHSNLYVLDIHGMKEQPFNLAIGTSGALSPNQSAMHQILQQTATEHNFTLQLNPKGYAADSPNSLTSQLKRSGHTAVVQLEIARSLRNPQADDAASERIINYLGDAITCLAKRNLQANTP